ncbi:MAG: type III pantothenate kinase [Candidatus Melainabacteria bacterium]|nr:MAG: type III pantothenate kinase [Candidatus Melainabacteria bacterium]
MNAMTNRRIVVNVGNSRTTWAIFDGDKLHKSWSNQTTLSRSQAPDIASDLDEGLNGESVENQIVYICSVVPSASLALIEALHEQGFDPREIRLDMQKGIRGFYPTFGTDRLANCYAAYKIYGSKCDNLLVLDFGTATTISAVSSAGEFLGGMITLGFQDTLTTIGKRLEQLPVIDYDGSGDKVFDSVSPLSNSTRDSIFAGALYSQLGTVEKWVRKCKQELDNTTFVVATGGLSRYIGQHIEQGIIDAFDKELTLKGVNFIAQELEAEVVPADLS